MFLLHEDSHIVRDHIGAFCFSLPQKDFDTFYEPFLKNFSLLFLIIFSQNFDRQGKLSKN